MNVFQKFFIFCSGADVTTLADATTVERNTFVTIGITTLIPPLLAFCSGSYAARLLTGDQQIAVSFGLLWALIIFIIDRAVVSSMSKSVLPAVGRLCLSIVISVVVSLPFELYLFRDAINEELNRSFGSDVVALEALYAPRVEVIDADLKQREAEINSLRADYLSEMDGTGGSGETGYGPKALIKQQEYQQSKSEFSDYQQRKLLERSVIKKQEAKAIDRLKAKQASGLLGQWKALGQIAKGEPFVQYASWAIRLLLILIELIPILVKFSSSTTHYQRLITVVEQATIAAVVPIIVSREQIKALRVEVIQQRELHDMMLEKINEVAQHQVNQAETEIEHQLKMGKLEEKATGLFAKLSIRPIKIDDFIDRIHKIIDRRSENLFEISSEDAAIEDLLNEI